MKRTRAKRAPSAVRAPQQIHTTSPAPPLLETKLAPPMLRSNILDRPRLTAQLDLISERRVALIVAPVGYGKTTLAAHWLAARSSELRVTSSELFQRDQTQNSELKTQNFQ